MLVKIIGKNANPNSSAVHEYLKSAGFSYSWFNVLHIFILGLPLCFAFFIICGIIRT